MMKKTCFLVLLVSILICGESVKGQNDSAKLSASFCDLIINPEVYEGKEVTVKATYRYGFEWQELYCLTCRDRGRTWLEIDESIVSSKTKKALRKLPGKDGTINATFTGTFASSGGPFGDGGYRFRFALKEISQIEVISKSGADPNRLPTDKQRNVCKER